MVGLRSGDALRAASPHALCSHSRAISRERGWAEGRIQPEFRAFPSEVKEVSPVRDATIHPATKCSYSRCCGDPLVLPRRTSEISWGSHRLEASVRRRNYASGG